jgi:uncharacterized protein YndB with AHSA1/START domain
MTIAPKVTLRVSHLYTASAERVFDAWLDPATAGSWLFATPTGRIVAVEIDARIGGKFAIVRREGEDIAHIGEYLEIERPRRLVFTFAVPKFSAEITRVIIEIAALDKGCELTLTHEGVLPDYEENTKQGWGMILGNLGRSPE